MHHAAQSLHRTARNRAAPQPTAVHHTNHTHIIGRGASGHVARARGKSNHTQAHNLPNRLLPPGTHSLPSLTAVATAAPCHAVLCSDAGHEGSVEDVGFSQQLPWAASASLDSNLSIWELERLVQRGTCAHPAVSWRLGAGPLCFVSGVLSAAAGRVICCGDAVAGRADVDTYGGWVGCRWKQVRRPRWPHQSLVGHLSQPPCDRAGYRPDPDTGTATFPSRCWSSLPTPQCAERSPLRRSAAQSERWPQD